MVVVYKSDMAVTGVITRMVVVGFREETTRNCCHVIRNVCMFDRLVSMHDVFCMELK